MIGGMAVGSLPQVAVIGAGIAGAACAHALQQAGLAVQVFDKSRGAGGRLATRRCEWLDREGQRWTTRLDHGAVGITAHSAAFQAFVDQALQAGHLAEWTPQWAADDRRPEDRKRRYVPVPDQPALCRHLLQAAATTWGAAVEGLQRAADGWRVQAGAEQAARGFDAVVLALPPAQAASLLGPHRPDWARHASVVPMQPCWTLMGVEDASQSAGDAAREGSLARPTTGPLAWVLRQDARPGRARVPGQAHWVVHARAGWSRQHLEQPADWVEQQLQRALAESLGRPIEWLHSAVHRWRYALPPLSAAPLAASCWWDADLRLGVCGDFLGGTGVDGVEGAWLSAQALSKALLQGAGRSSAPTEAVAH